MDPAARPAPPVDTAADLVTSGSLPAPEALAADLREAGELLGADRAYVFENIRDPDGRLWMNLTAEWLREDTRGVFEDPATRLHPYSPDFRRWIEVLGSGGVLADRVADLPEPERRVLADEGTVSFVAVPILVDGDWWGYLGVDDCGGGHAWSQGEIDVLRSLAVTIGENVTRRRRISTEEIVGDRHRAIVEHAPVVTYIDALDDAASTVFISPQVRSLTGYSPEEWTKDPDLWVRILHPEDRNRAVAENQRHNETGESFSLDYRIHRKDGRVVFLAYHDEVTGLPSRVMFEELLDLAIGRASRHDACVAVVCVDVDDFRLVNDSLGRLAGDELLRLGAGRPRGGTRETDLVARRSGDTFLLLLSDLEREGDDVETAVARAGSAAQRILDALTPPFRTGGTELYVSASIGISLFPQDGDEAGVLLRNAEAAMLESKKGHAYVVSNRGALDSTAKLQFVTRLRKAVDSQRWTLRYQPILDLASGRMEGVEALIRWIEPDGTMVPPAEFIPLAEELGLIEAIGEWVIREIVYQAQAWRGEGIALENGFNPSPRQFSPPDPA